MDLPITKFAVVYLDTLMDVVEILSVHDDIRDALKFMMHTIDSNENYSDPQWIKKQYENSKSVSIYSCHWVATKTLIARYFVLPFVDTN